jgi:DNA-binding SARP family transcriptional activator
MEFRILGPLEVVREGQPLPPGGARPRALLAILLLNANQVVSVDRLVDDVWNGRPPETAVHAIQVYVSQLRNLLGDGSSERSRIATRAPGYVLSVGPDEFDLHRLERLLAGGREALSRGDATSAAATFREALGLWRGPSLADFAFDAFAQTPIARLEELRLVAQEERIEADLALGRHGELVSELQALVGEHPLRERLRAQLMLALYRSGRQAEALQAYQDARAALVDELGIDPTARLQSLERAILNQDPSLDLQAPVARGPLATPARSILLLPRRDDDLDALARLAAPLADARVPHELILARFVEAGELSSAGEALQAKRRELEDSGVPTRVAAFTTADWAEDATRLSSQQEVDLLLVAERAEEVPAALERAPLRRLLEEAACDVGVVARLEPRAGGPVVVPFGGGEHEWGALELGAWLASAAGEPLYLLGTEAREEEGQRDASRLLATAALAVQQLAGIVTEPVLVPAGPEGVVAAAADASLVVLGLSRRWRDDGLGPARHEVLVATEVPVILARKGTRPGGLTPPEELTRFTWSLAAPR